MHSLSNTKVTQEISLNSQNQFHLGSIVTIVHFVEDVIWAVLAKVMFLGKKIHRKDRNLIKCRNKWKNNRLLKKWNNNVEELMINDYFIRKILLIFIEFGFCWLCLRVLTVSGINIKWKLLYLNYHYNVRNRLTIYTIFVAYINK